MLGGKFKVLAIMLYLLLPLSVQAQKKSPKALDQEKTFLRVLVEFKNYPQFFDYLPKGENSFKSYDSKEMKLLNPKVLQARFLEFNVKFLNFERTKNQIQSALDRFEKKVKKTPLTELKSRREMELKIAALKDNFLQAQRTLFWISVEANHSLLDAMDTMSPKNKKLLADSKKTSEIPPQMPGTFQDTLSNRERLQAQEKMNLTPVDGEFYESQLGKKMEKDLGGRAEAWSYDFESDELFVKVKNEIGKLRVREETGSGVRFIQTRVGRNFIDPVGSDERIELEKAQGKFLTGDANSETLFGRMPSSEPEYVREPTDSHGAEGHDHDHEH